VKQREKDKESIKSKCGNGELEGGKQILESWQASRKKQYFQSNYVKTALM
jgi:hypothetical protein